MKAAGRPKIRWTDSIKNSVKALTLQDLGKVVNNGPFIVVVLFSENSGVTAN